MSKSVLHRKRILVVEDQGIVAADIARGLEDAGYEIAGVATSGESAILKASGSCPDLVLMDIRLNGSMDGIETAGLLQEQFDVPVIYLTALADRGTLDRAKKTEPMAFLLKPFRRADLMNAIEIGLRRVELEKAAR